VVGLWVYAPALSGDFISDDQHYVQQNPYVHALDLDSLIAIVDPTSVVTRIVENYAPVHLILHGLEWQLFGEEVFGYHVVNVLLHALAAWLLIPVFLRSGIPLQAATVGAAVFLLHPANVESVAWISQLKSSAAMVLSLGAILAHPHRPAAAAILFGLALFAKPFSAFALFVVALSGWLRAEPATAAVEERRDWRWGWLGVWLVTLVVFAVLETLAFRSTAGQAPPLYADLGVRYRTILSIALRYLLMAATGRGLSAFHEPPPVVSFVDPWLLASLPVLALLGWRLLATLRRREEESLYWAWALISFAPLSGVVPLPFPMADRYLYFVLPGLVGAALLAGAQALGWLQGRLGGGRRRQRQLHGGAFALGILLLLHWGAASHARAGIWVSAERLMADAEIHYPDGAAANTRRAGRAARVGDFPAAVAALRAAWQRGYNRLDHLLTDPSYAPMQSYPDFVALKNEMADEWIGRLGRNPEPSQIELRALAQAYVVKGDLDAALEALERGAAIPGPITETLLDDADRVRREVRLRERLAERLRRGDGSAPEAGTP